MNFVGECPPDHDGLTACKGGMHELYWKNGYLFLWALIFLVSGAAIVSFVLLGIIPLPTSPFRSPPVAAAYEEKEDGEKRRSPKVEPGKVEPGKVDKVESGFPMVAVAAAAEAAEPFNKEMKESDSRDGAEGTFRRET